MYRVLARGMTFLQYNVTTKVKVAALAVVLAVILGLATYFAMVPPVPPESRTVRSVEKLNDEFIKQIRLPFQSFKPSIREVILTKESLETRINDLIEQSLLMDPGTNTTFARFYALADLPVKPKVPKPDVGELRGRIRLVLEQIVALGDELVATNWRPLQPFSFPRSFFTATVVDGKSGRPKFDTALFFVPINSSYSFSISSASPKTVEVKVANDNIFGFTIFTDVVKASYDDPPGLITITQNLKRLTLSANFSPSRTGILGVFMNLFSEPLAGLGTPESVTLKKGESLQGVRLISNISASGCVRFRGEWKLLGESQFECRFQASLTPGDQLVRVSGSFVFFANGGSLQIMGDVDTSGVGDGSIVFSSLLIVSESCGLTLKGWAPLMIRLDLKCG